MEIHKGDWQSHLWAEIPGRFPGEMGLYKSDPWNMRPSGEGAESFADMHARVCAWFGDVSGNTVVVSHGGPMRCLRRHLLGLGDAETFALPTPQDQMLCVTDGALSWF
jgi:probable phosphoglycerate mutase